MGHDGHEGIFMDTTHLHELCVRGSVSVGVRAQSRRLPDDWKDPEKKCVRAMVWVHAAVCVTGLASSSWRVGLSLSWRIWIRRN